MTGARARRHCSASGVRARELDLTTTSLQRTVALRVPFRFPRRTTDFERLPPVQGRALGTHRRWDGTAHGAVFFASTSGVATRCPPRKLLGTREPDRHPGVYERPSGCCGPHGIPPQAGLDFASQVIQHARPTCEWRGRAVSRVINRPHKRRRRAGGAHNTLQLLRGRPDRGVGAWRIRLRGPVTSAASPRLHIELEARAESPKHLTIEYGPAPRRPGRAEPRHLARKRVLSWELYRHRRRPRRTAEWFAKSPLVRVAIVGWDNRDCHGRPSRSVTRVDTTPSRKSSLAARRAPF